MTRLFALPFAVAVLSLATAPTPLPSSDAGPPSAAAAVPPTELPALTLPSEVTGDAGEFITVAADTNGTVVRWHVIDPGLNLFPVDLLRDTRTAVVTSPREGRYRLLGYTAVGDVPSAPSVVTVVVGDSPEPEPTPPGPEPDPEPDLKGVALVVYTAAKGVDDAIVSQAAGAYGSQVSAINAGAYNALELDDAKQQIVDAISAANPPRQEARSLFEVIDGELQKLEDADKLGTLAAVSAALTDITTGLEAAAK